MTLFNRYSIPFGVRIIILTQLLAMMIFGGAATAVLLYHLPDSFDLLPEHELHRFLNLLLDLSGLIIIVGLFWMRRWAWLLLLVRLGLDMLLELGLYVQDDPQYLSMFLNIITVFYVAQGEVQRAFQKRGRAL